VTGSSVTNGWDAVCAMNVDAVNALFFEQFVDSDPVSPYRLLQVPIVDGTDFWILDVVLGHPEIAFGATEGQVQMFLVRGWLMSFDPTKQVVQSAVQIVPDTSWLTGPLDLGRTHGTVSATGQVYAALGAGAWSPSITGVDPASALSTEIGTAIATFFANNDTTYQLGSLGTSNAPACLTPTNFTFALQPAPGGSGDGCVLLLIQTTGPGGTPGPLATYPIEDGFTAALIVSNEVLVSGLLQPSLAAALQKTGTTVTAQQENGVWQISTSGGTINLGVINNPNPGPNPYPGANYNWWENYVYPTSGDGETVTKPAPVTVSASGLTVVPNASGTVGIDLAWSSDWSQNWGYVGVVLHYGYLPNGENVGMKATFAQTSSAQVGSNNLITFGGTPSATAAPTSTPDWFEKHILGEIDVSGALSSSLKNVLSQWFGSLPLPDMQTFSLVNLLFPSEHALTLKSATVPCDLVAPGVLQAPLTVAPAFTTLAPGGQVALAATDPDGQSVSVTWEVTNGPGTITTQGVYTAPSSISGAAELAIVHAIDAANTQVTGGALILVANLPTPTALLVDPPSLLVTAGQSYAIQVTDSTGNPVQATFASPEYGTIDPGFETGQFIYAAPSPVNDMTSFTITATSVANPSETGTASITLSPTTTVTVTAASESVVAGGTLDLSATAPGLEELTWLVFPIGVGSIAAQGDTTTAIYTAPASVDGATTVTIIAYGIGAAAGVGLTRITVYPPSWG
jgi:hypothetical protein